MQHTPSLSVDVAAEEIHSSRSMQEMEMFPKMMKTATPRTRSFTTSTTKWKKPICSMTIFTSMEFPEYYTICTGKIVKLQNFIFLLTGIKLALVTWLPCSSLPHLSKEILWNFAASIFRSTLAAFNKSLVDLFFPLHRFSTICSSSRWDINEKFILFMEKKSAL